MEKVGEHAWGVQKEKYLIEIHLFSIGRIVLGWIHIWISTKTLDRESVESVSYIDLAHICQNWKPQNWWVWFRLLMCSINHSFLNASRKSENATHHRQNTSSRSGKTKKASKGTRILTCCPLNFCFPGILIIRENARQKEKIDFPKRKKVLPKQT